MAEVGVSRGAVEDPGTDGALDVFVRNCTAHVVHGGYPTGVWTDYPGYNSKRHHRHTGHRPARDPMEGGGGADRQLSTRKPPVAQRFELVQVQKRYGDYYNGVEYRSRALQHIPRPPLPGIPGAKEGL